MTEMAAESGRARGNVFTRKIGPLPMWAWLGIVGGAVVAWEFYRNQTTSSASTGSATPASDVPQFVNQVYTSPGPPMAPGPAPKPGLNVKDSTRIEATGSQSLSALAKQYGTTVALIMEYSKARLDAGNLKKLMAAAAHPARKLAKGTVLYVPGHVQPPGNPVSGTK